MNAVVWTSSEDHYLSQSIHSLLPESSPIAQESSVGFESTRELSAVADKQEWVLRCVMGPCLLVLHVTPAGADLPSFFPRMPSVPCGFVYTLSWQSGLFSVFTNVFFLRSPFYESLVKFRCVAALSHVFCLRCCISYFFLAGLNNLRNYLRNLLLVDSSRV